MVYKRKKTTKNTEENKIKEVLESNNEYIEFSWRKFKTGVIYVHCNTEEKAKDFVKKAFENDCGWYRSDIPKTYFIANKEETCYRITNNSLGLVELSYRLHKEYPVIKWEIEEAKEGHRKYSEMSIKELKK